jgi:AraC family transcriptional regulator
MQPRIETLTGKKLVGKRLTMTFANNQTFRLWQSFMPRRKEIRNNLTADLISMQVYPPSFDFTFANLNAEFEKWAAVEVANFDLVPDEMETFILSGGLYAVFDYIGLSSDPQIFQYIFGTWLPNSIYTIDYRPHFEILGEKYKNNDPTSEEEIWIPIRLKE